MLLHDSPNIMWDYDMNFDIFIKDVDSLKIII